MQYNYIGSVAQRNVVFTSGITVTEEDSSVENFNSLVVYVPSFLASGNIVDYDGTGLTASVPIVKTVTATNYSSVLTGELLSQWGPVFNSGANTAVTLYVVVFYCPNTTEVPFSGQLTVSAKAISHDALTAAFSLTYYAGYLKFMFSEHYDGTSSTTAGSAYDDSHYFDLALCLSYLVENETTISATINFVHLDLTGATTNACGVIDTTAVQEETAMTALNATIEGTATPRDYYFWGALHLVAGDRVYVCVHSEAVNYIPLVLALFYSAVNTAGIYVGNKLYYIRLSGDSIKPTGTPSVLDSAANNNITAAQATNLDGKSVGYLASIADGTVNNAVLWKLDSVTNAVPILAPMISKYVDYHCSQDLAKWLTAQSTLTNPVLKSQAAYSYVQSVLSTYLGVFSAIGRLESVSLNFPAYSSQTSKNSFTVSQGWTATYVQDLRKIAVSGTVTV